MQSTQACTCRQRRRLDTSGRRCLRGITSGDQVRVFNDLGATELPAKVTDRIAPGVISIKEGAWYTPNGQGVDTVGCGNVLSADTSARCGATTYNTNHAQVEKI